MVLVLAIVLITIASACAYMLIRNEMVYRERTRMINKCSASSLDSWQQVLAQYNQYTYNEMLLKFWKPVKSFYREYR
jgi:hypothetical protein